MLLGLDRLEAQLLAFGHQRQPVLQLLVVFVLLILAFFVDFQEALELRHAAGGAEHVRRAVLALGGHVDGGLIEHRRRHLRRDKAHPDQPVQLQLVFLQIRRDIFGSAPRRRRPNGFVRVLRVLLALIDVGRFGNERSAVAVLNQAANFVQRVVGHARGIGSHISDETDRAFRAQLHAFIQPLRQHHGPLHAEPQLARRLLLQRGRDERRDRVALLLLAS